MKILLSVLVVIILNLIIFGLTQLFNATYEEVAAPVLVGLVASMLVEVSSND